MVPPPLPECLQNLTMTEEMLIARASPVVKVVRLAGGMHGYDGHVLSMGQDIGEFATRLPWLPTSDEIPVVIIQSGDGGGSWAGRHFKVNLGRVERGLLYLIQHSPAYRGIVNIDMDRLRRSLTGLGRDENGDVDVMHLFHTVTDETPVAAMAKVAKGWSFASSCPSHALVDGVRRAERAASSHGLLAVRAVPRARPRSRPTHEVHTAGLVGASCPPTQAGSHCPWPPRSVV